MVPPSSVVLAHGCAAALRRRNQRGHHGVASAVTVEADESGLGDAVSRTRYVATGGGSRIPL